MTDSKQLPDIDTLVDGFTQINQAYIERPGFNRSEYMIMVSQYLLTHLLGDDFGFYDHPDEVGFTGWLVTEDQTLFFAPTKVVVLERAR